MSFSPLIRQLIDALRTLPGVGQKTAQRMALQLLERSQWRVAFGAGLEPGDGRRGALPAVQNLDRR